MKLRKIIAAVLAFALVVTAVPTEGLTKVKAAGETQTISAVNTDYMHWSDTVGAKKESNVDVLYCVNQEYVRADLPLIESLREDVINQFNETGSEWNWFAYRIDVKTEGTYKLGVKTQGCKFASFAIPLCVNNEVYTLTYTASSQTRTVDVNLPVGVYVVTMFMPMPVNQADVENSVWNDYPWCNVESVVVNADVADVEIVNNSNAPLTDADVVASFPSKVEAGDTTYVTYDHMPSGGYAKNNSDAGGVSRGKVTQTLADLIGENNSIKCLDKAGLPYVQYTAEVTKTGEYYLKAGFTTSALAGGNQGDTLFTIIVNNKVYEVGTWVSSGTNMYNATVKVQLEAGLNVIRTTGIPKDSKWYASSWIDHDYLVVDPGVKIIPVNQTSVNGGDETKVLANKFTDNGNSLNSVSAGDMRTDLPTIATLPYGGNLIERWPFASVKVTAEKNGYYDITVNAGMNTGTVSPQLGVLVDGTSYSMPFKKVSPTGIDASLYLTAGEHIITFFIPMPEEISTDVQSDGTYYSWMDYNTIVFGTGLTNISKPSIDGIKAHLGTTYHAGDENYVLSNHYTDNGNTLGGASRGDMQYSKYTIEGLEMSQLSRIPYAAVMVNAEADGSYDICLEVAPNTAAEASSQIALLVDGDVQQLNFTKNTKTTISTEVELTQGLHLLIFTSPMPVNAEKTIVGNGNEYPWFDFNKIHLDKGLSISNNMNVAAQSVELSSVSKNWVTYKDDEIDKVEVDYLEAYREDLKNDTDRVSVENVLEHGLTRVPYMSVTVTAQQEGWYDIYATVNARANRTSQYAAMIVDGTEVYPVQLASGDDKQKIGTFIKLTAGTHTIAVTTAMPLTEEEAQAITDPSTDSYAAMNSAYPWLNFYSFTVSGRLSVEENPLVDKSILFVGDSITHSEVSWASKIGTWNQMDWTNAAIKGATITTVSARHIVHQLKANAANNYDYVIMHGGINDAMSKAEIGKVSESWDVAAFDNETYIGALETMFYYAYENFENAKLGYIINYATPNSDWGGHTQDMKAYFDEAKRACEKWGISYIDLYEGTVDVNGQELSYSYDILQVDKKASIFSGGKANEIHLSDEGYRLITPYVETWVKTLEANDNPLEEREENRRKYVDAGNESKVFYNGFTAKEGVLQDRVYTDMAEDEANIALLPYAKELLGDWAFASIKVNAKEAGNYKIIPEISAKIPTQIGMLVDGDAYTLNYTKTLEGSCQFIEQTVYLTEGVHYITFTAAMPKEAVDVVGNAWDIYPWTNIFTIVVEPGLEIMDKPELSEVTALLGTLDDLGETKVNAGDETKVLSNYFKDNGDTLGNLDAGDLRYDKLTLDKVSVDNTPYMPYAAIKVNAEADGTYDILLEIETNTKTISDQIGLIVDGKDVQVLPFKLVSPTKIKATVALQKGTHILTFTSPMPETAKEYGEYAKQNELTQGNGTTHPWINFNTFILSKGLTIENVPTIAEVENPHYTRIESENSKYVVYQGYTNKTEAAPKASGGTVIGGVNRWEMEQTFEELKVWIDGSSNHTPYVEYAVEAPEDGEYTIRAGFLADVNKKVENRGEIAKPFVAVLVNHDIYKAQYTADWGESEAVAVDVTLKKGLNIIRVTSYTTDQEIFTVSSWVNQDFLDIDKRLTAVERTATVVEAENSEFYNLIASQAGAKEEKASNDKVLGSAKVIRAKSIGLTMENFTVEQIKMIPYFSFTVDAPQDGYYSLSMNFCGDGRLAKSQIAMIVDDEISVVKYNRSGKASEQNKAIITVYLEKGEHTMTFTSPLPMDTEEMAATDWSHRWMNFDYLTLYDGLVLAKTQKSPTNIEDLVRIEAEDVGLPNMTKVNAAAEGKDAKEGFVGSAKYRRSQTVAQIQKNGIDERTTPFVQYTVNAKQAGTYTVYFEASYGIYKPTVQEMDATVAIEVDGKVSFHTVHCVKDKTNSSLIPVTMELSKGNHVVRLSHLTGDSIKGEGYCWIDYNYIEVTAADSKNIAFVPTNGVVEAERSEAVTYVGNSSSGSSGGQCLGNGDYKYVDEKDVTFANLDVKNLGELSRVTYTVIAEKAGTYYLSVQFNGGVINYTFNELVEKGTIGFAVSVNEGEKQLVEFCPDAGTGSMSRIIEVDLQEGENNIMVTTTLADYISGVSPRVEDEYRLYWIDHDAIRLTAGVSSTNTEVEPYDVNNTDIDHAQLSAEASNVIEIEEENETNMVAVATIVGSALALAVLFIILIFLKKKKKEDAEQ